MVLAMFAFAITATGLLYVYWRMHIAPFLPLQKALAATFKDSRPRVEGGQRKIHKGTPRIFRVTMKIDFDPDVDVTRTTAFAHRVVAFVREHEDLTPWGTLEIRFYWPEPEKTLHEWALAVELSNGVPRGEKILDPQP